jgi:hypothetical protein
MANIISVILSNSVPGPKRDDAVKPQLYIYKVDAVPSAGSGTAAALGTTAIYEDGATATRYLKTGVSDVDWTAEAPATSQLFTQTNPSDWVTDPQTIQEALDELAAEAYTPSVATDWAAVPTTVAAALDELTRNGAGHFQKARDPLLTPAPTIYVETTGSDDTGDGSLALPFATIARALQSLPAMPENTTASTQIQVGAGSFVLPRKANYTDVTMLATARTVAYTYAVDAVQPANTLQTGTRVVLNTADLAATVAPELTRVYFPALGVSGVVDKSDNSAAGKLVLWVVTDYPDAFTPAVLSNVQILATATTLRVPSQTTISGGSWQNCTFAPVGAIAYLTLDGNSSLDYCDFDRVSPTIIGTVQTTLPSSSAQFVVFGGAFSTYSALFSRTANGACLNCYGGTLILPGETAFLGPAAGASNAIVALGTKMPNAGGASVIRVVRSITNVIVVDNVAIGGFQGSGGNYDIGDVLQNQTLAAAQIVGLTAFIANVGALAGAVVRLGVNSAITIGAVLNPVAIGGVAKATDSSGTYIVGGSPKPGANGASTQYVIANAATWDGISRTVVFTTATMGAAVFNMPAIALGVGITDSASVKLINSDGVAAVTVTPFAGEKIDGVAAATTLGGIGVKAGFELTVRASTNNWMLS